MEQIHDNIGSYLDRHGKVRWRYRRGSFCVSLPGRPGDSGFEAAYAAAVTGSKLPTREVAMRRERFSAAFAERALARAKDRAKRKDLEFTVGVADVERLFRDQDWRCAVSRMPFDLARATKDDVPFRPSLDRVSTGGGYTPDNVRVVCEIVNLAMNRWGPAPLFALVEAMANRVANPIG